ncbi:MAG TPA: shikimate kinase [Micromonosporaceae bacterium]|nr:shikimate kinase [Micromonosporaceae bacterium]HCU50370.1 shikimate kinase [Micromonosporaceae bacterium]
MKPLAVIVGAPGAGKSTIGRTLASELGVSFRDTDSDIELAAGQPIPDIFVDEGEEHFRALERYAVAKALSDHDGVLAVGGGAVLATQTRALLKEHTVVYLTVDLADAVHRVGLDSGRPLLMVNPRATLRFLLEQRRPLYEEVATYTVDTAGRSPEEITAEIVKVLA